ncbi:MAG: hypothetical protein GY775_17330, partial [Candidatus Scalindua sp.]|nr:hypothetical protein [Candidatus Scalindua sp.]
TAIEKESAQESWKIQKEQLAAQKAASLIQIATNTAIGVSQALAQGGVLGIATGALVAAAGAVQAGVVLSQPDPPRPQLNTGAIVKGSNAGVPVTVGENRYDELIMSRSPKGEGIMDGFADALSNKMGGGQPLVVNINTTFGLQSDEEKLEAAEQIYDAIIETGQRRGVS